MSSSPSVPYLPDDLLVICLARVSKLYYPTLSLVSKRFRSLLSSLELYETRTRLGCTESCLYVRLFLPYQSHPLRWFTLCQKPIQINDPPNPSYFAPDRSLKNCTTKKENKSSEHVLVSIPACKSAFEASGAGLIAVGCNIYMIGGYENNGAPSSKVYVMDCRSHTWHKGPSMRVARSYPLMSVLDGKIYVVEGFQHLDLLNFMECFDPKTEKWEYVQSPRAEIFENFVIGNETMEGKIYLFGNKSMVYNPKENRWDAIGLLPFMFQGSHLSCEIDNVFYFLDVKLPGMINWYDAEEMSWRFLKGLEKLPTISMNGIALVNNGGKIAFCWEEDGCSNEKMIWCAEISLERRSKKEIYGNIYWCKLMLRVPNFSSSMHLISAAV